MKQLETEEFTKEDIDKYLSDLSNLLDTGWFNNPRTDIADYTFYHKNFKNLRQFVSKGMYIISHIK